MTCGAGALAFGVRFGGDGGPGRRSSTAPWVSRTLPRCHRLLELPASETVCAGAVACGTQGLADLDFAAMTVDGLVVRPQPTLSSEKSSPEYLAGGAGRTSSQDAVDAGGVTRTHGWLEDTVDAGGCHQGGCRPGADIVDVGGLDFATSPPGGRTGAACSSSRCLACASAREAAATASCCASSSVSVRADGLAFAGTK